jgi:hypothetical protein
MNRAQRRRYATVGVHVRPTSWARDGHRVRPRQEPELHCAAVEAWFARYAQGGSGMNARKGRSPEMEFGRVESIGLTRSQGRPASLNEARAGLSQGGPGDGFLHARDVACGQEIPTAQAGASLCRMQDGSCALHDGAWRGCVLGAHNVVGDDDTPPAAHALDLSVCTFAAAVALDAVELVVTAQPPDQARTVDVAARPRFNAFGPLAWAAIAEGIASLLEHGIGL